MAEARRWIITLSDEGSLNKLSREVTETGFAIDQILSEIRCITGTASEDVAQKIRSTPGVADVSPDGSINIGPPDKELTW